MAQSTLLASIDLSDRGKLEIFLLRSPGNRQLVEIRWPSPATITSIASYDNVIASVMRVLAVASVQLHNRKAYPTREDH
jgi:hypothetical protein